MFLLLAGDVEIKPLNYRWLSQATFLPRHVVQGCVQETMLLYSFQLRKRKHLAFAFKGIGVLSCEDNILCMRFYHECVVGLESKASQIALLHTVSCSGFEGCCRVLGKPTEGRATHPPLASLDMMGQSSAFPHVHPH